MKVRLVSLEAAFTILKLAVAIYPPGAWLRYPPTMSNGHTSTGTEFRESWDIRSGLSQWAWRTISELGEEADGKGTFKTILLHPAFLTAA